jgi:apolipoprotein N-acyltransferase
VTLRSIFLPGHVFDKSGLLAAASGILIALSFPDAGLSLLIWIALIPLLTAMEHATPRQAFRLGFICGCSAYAVILYWITIVMTRYGHLPWAVSIPLYLLLVAWLALFFGGAALMARLGEQMGIKSALTLPIAWVAFDFSRSWLLSGFPWAMLGHSQFRTLPLIQIADLCGVYGITALIVLANIVLYRAFRAVSGSDVPYPVKSLAVLLVLFAATLLYGFQRLNQRPPESARAVKTALIQGNIPQDVKWSPEFRNRTIDTYERLTRSAAGSGVDLIVWPESAVPFFFQDEPEPAARIRGLARELSAALMVGSPAHELYNGKRVFLNSVFMIDPTGETVGRGDKLHLVPFGEYVPLGRYFPFISKLVVGIGDFSPGTKAVTLPVAGTRVGTLVCYEVVFPELARRYVNNGARIMVNITNDAWFGRSSAPYQHLSIAAFRSVETRTPMIRAANTGITAIIDQNGYIRTMTGLFVEGYRTGEVVPGTARSLYLTIGDLPAWICLFLTAILAIAAVFRRTDTQQGEHNVP